MQTRLLSIDGKSRGVADHEGEVVWSLARDLVQTNPRVANCQGQALAEVRNTTNLGYVLLTVVILGFVSPQRIDWRCASPTPSEGGLRVPSR